MLRILCTSLVLGFNILLPWTGEFVANNPELRQSQTPASRAGDVASQSPPASSKPDEVASAPYILIEARDYYRKGDLDRSIEKYRQVLQMMPNSSDAYAGLTRVYL